MCYNDFNTKGIILVGALLGWALPSENCQLEITCFYARALALGGSALQALTALNIGDADIAEELSCTGVITLYILSIATFIVLQSISP